MTHELPQPNQKRPLISKRLGAELIRQVEANGVAIVPPKIVRAKLMLGRKLALRKHA